jgi:hypothetical protein
MPAACVPLPRRRGGLHYITRKLVVTAQRAEYSV